MKRCTSCGDIKENEMFSPMSISKPKILRSHCKSCRSKRSYRFQLEKKKANSPNNYLECTNEECMHIWFYRDKYCPKCGHVGEL